MKLKPSPAMELKKLREKIDDILDRGVEQFLLPFADTEKPIYIYVYGYTPCFNDGDPCTHSSYAEDKDGILADDIIEYSSGIFGDLTRSDVYDSADWPETEEFKEAIKAVKEVLDYKYDTDYQVLITIKDKNVCCIKDDYDCGY